MGGQRVEVVTFDPVSVGYSHAMFNAAIVRALGVAANVDGIHLLLEKSALESTAFRGLTALPKVKACRALPEGSLGHGRWAEMKRSVVCHAQMFRAVSRRRSIVCLHLAADNLMSPLSLLLGTVVRGGCACVILHNNAHRIKASRAARLLWGAVFRSGVRPIVLAQSVHEFYDRLYPRVRFNLIPHPSYAEVGGPGEANVREPERRFLFLGRHGRSSATVEFLGRFISACSAARDGDPMTIVAERSVASQVADMAGGAGIGLRMYDWPAEHDDYYGMLRKARFVVFPPHASDRITASGVHADATSCCVPVIAPTRGVFRENVPDSGARLLYDDVQSDLHDVVASAVGMSAAAYQELRSDVADVRRRCDTVRTAERLNGLLTAVG
ncbi:MAG: hypothetical protein OXQ31_09200 [Spirochaetaceae bacterium]|nr:hypothetical protein [Spirochaetaceae bacterium]